MLFGSLGGEGEERRQHSEAQQNTCYDLHYEKIAALAPLTIPRGIELELVFPGPKESS